MKFEIILPHSSLYKKVLIFHAVWFWNILKKVNSGATNIGNPYTKSGTRFTYFGSLYTKSGTPQKSRYWLMYNILYKAIIFPITV